MNKDKHDQKIINLLKQLPKVEDRTTKEELYQQIQGKISQPRSSQTASRKNPLIPILSTILAIIIMVIIVPTFFDDHLFFSSINNDAHLTESAKNDGHMEQSVTMLNETPTETETVETQLALGDHDQRFVLDHLEQEATIVHGAVAEEQLQYVIPVTFILDNRTDISDGYNQLNHYLQEEAWHVHENMLQDAIFDINLSTNEVTVELPTDFSIGEGSARAHIFSELLTFMFRPIGIETVNFQARELDFGPYGEITELSLPEIERVNYKLFNHPSASRSFLIPTKQADQPIEAALVDMKNGDEDYYLDQTIPSDVEFTTQSSERTLIIEFTENTVIENNQQYLTMVESMLMTAKSYGYEMVIFENPTINQLGPYDLQFPLNVPVATNPIDLR